ncbi:MAG: 50S ribosomal protein L21e [Candidatus Helarchaeota archaeon]
MKRSKGYKSRHTRHIHRKKVRQKGQIRSLRYLLLRDKYIPGAKVDIIIDPSQHKGQPHYRYHGKTGTIIGQRGRAYLVSIKAGNKTKTLIIRPEHFRLQNLPQSK